MHEAPKCSGVGCPPIEIGPRPSGARPRRRALGTAFAVGLGVAALGGSPAVAVAADDCRNEAVRVQQNATHLPNCLAYEKVTPESKGGETPGLVLSSEDGGGIVFALNAGIADAASFVGGRYKSLRSADGRWTTNALQPAFDGPRLPSIGDGAGSPHAATSDLSRMVFDFAYPADPNDQGMANATVNVATQDVYLREADGSFTWVVPDRSVPDTSTLDVHFGAASPDLDRLVVATQRAWDPRVTTTNVEHLYVWTKSGTQLVTVLPNGDLATDLPYGETDGGVVNGGTEASADGRRIAFIDGASSGEGRLYVRFNADDPETAFTREVGIPPSGETCAGATNPKLSADGKQIVFTCYITNRPGGRAFRTYVRDLEGGPDAVRVLAEGTGVVVAATPDFSRVYLGMAEFDTDSSLLVVRDGEEAEVVATPESGGPVQAADISADGEYVAFTSASDFGLPGVDHSTLNGPQVYRYAARTAELTCVSCRSDGNPTEGAGSLIVGDVGGGVGGGGAVMSGMRPVSTRGTVAFSSRSALVPEDTNDQADAYAWVDGRPVLLSSGQSPLPSVAQGGSVDGSSFFFRTTDALTPDDRDGGVYDLYVARENGGRLMPEPQAAPCTANCQAPAPERPDLPGAGSQGFVGQGNLVEKATAPSTAAKRATASLTVSRSARGRSTSVRVKVSGAGSIRVSGSGLRPATVKAKKAGTYRVTVRLSAHGVKQQRSRGRLATKLTARFTPASGAAVSARKSVTFTAKKGGR